MADVKRSSRPSLAVASAAGPRGRPLAGQLRDHLNADGTTTYSFRVRYRGERVTVRLGNELEGWSRRLAELKLAQTLEEIAAGVWRPPVPDLPDDEHDPTFHEFATIWFDRHSADLDESTTESYSHVLSRYILPEFKDCRLTEITYESVIKWRDRLRQEAERLKLAKENGVTVTDRHGRPKRAFGTHTINEALRLLGQILSRAVESEHYVIDRNPVRGRSGLRLKSATRPPREHLEADEVASFIEAADLVDQGVGPRTLARGLQARTLRGRGLTWTQVAHEIGCAESTAIYLARIRGRSDAPRRRRALIVVLALSGMRASELTQLQWQRIDHTHGRIVLTDAKTAAGVREIHLSPFVRKELTLYRSSLEREPAADDHVFGVRSGGPTDRFNLGRRLKYIAKVAAQLRVADGLAPLPERITPHTFRRTYITLSIQAGQDLVFVQTQAGHADWKTTLEIYTQQSRRSIEPGIRRLLHELLTDDPAADGDTADSPLHQRRTVL
jgi:integrase